MASSEQTINAGVEGPDTERASNVYPRATEQQNPEEEAIGLVQRAVDILDDVHRLLQALAPSEIEAAVSRVYLGRVGDDRPALCWKLYATRHRVLADLFATQGEAFVAAAALLMQRTDEPRVTRR